MLYLNFRSVRYWGILCVLLLWATRAEAASVTLAWDPSPDPEVAGYTVGYGTQPGQYGVLVNAGLTTTFTIDSLPDGTYYFAVRAYTAEGLSSGFSNEVVATVTSGGTTTPPPTTQPVSSCTTPDPFAALGGGTCYNGGWLPPGMAIPGGSPAPAPVPPPTSPTPPPPPSTGSCSTADPFAALGGGTCYNGGWLPPGMPVPSGTPAPTPAPAPPPTAPPPPSPVPPSNAGSCSTADPFAGLGGGTCYNGGWLPPGMPVPGGGSSTPAPAPSPAPTPEAPTGVSTTCGIADPFVSLGGGTCHKGAWLPPGMEITVTGTLQVLSVEDGLWLVESEDGAVYTSPSELPAEKLVDGAVVTITALTLPSTSGTDGAAVIEVVAIEIH